MSADSAPRTDSQAVSLADEEAVKQVLVNTVHGLWEVVNNLTRLRPSRRDRYRLSHLVLVADAFVVAPGGIGTVLEAMMIWQLLQVRHVADTPLIFVGKMWAELVDWAKKHMLGEQPLASPGDMTIPHCLATADEA